MLRKIYRNVSSGFGDTSISAHVLEDVPVGLARKCLRFRSLDTPCLRVDCLWGLITQASILVRDASFS